MKAIYIDPLEALRNSGKRAGMQKVDIDTMITDVTNDLTVNGQPIGPVAIFRNELTSARGENLIFYLDGGEMRALRLKEGDFGRELVQIMTAGLSNEMRDWSLQSLAGLSKVLRAGVTTSPSFDADLTDLEVRDPEGAEPVRPEIGQDVG